MRAALACFCNLLVRPKKTVAWGVAENTRSEPHGPESHWTGAAPCADRPCDMTGLGDVVENFLQALAAGLLVGPVYGLMCVGLGIIFSVMRVINFAQGEFLMLGKAGLGGQEVSRA